MCWNNFAVAVFLILQNAPESASFGDAPNACAAERHGTQQGPGSRRAVNTDAVAPVALAPATRDAYLNLIDRTDALRMLLRDASVTNHPFTCDHRGLREIPRPRENKPLTCGDNVTGFGLTTFFDLSSFSIPIVGARFEARR